MPLNQPSSTLLPPEVKGKTTQVCTQDKQWEGQPTTSLAFLSLRRQQGPPLLLSPGVSLLSVLPGELSPWLLSPHYGEGPRRGNKPGKSLPPRTNRDSRPFFLLGDLAYLLRLKANRLVSGFSGDFLVEITVFKSFPCNNYKIFR